MGFRVLRRNGRTASIEPAYKGAILLLTISLAVFASGALSLAWALGMRASPQEQAIQPTAQMSTEDNDESPYGDLLISSAPTQAEPDMVPASEQPIAQESDLLPQAAEPEPMPEPPLPADTGEPASQQAHAQSPETQVAPARDATSAQEQAAPAASERQSRTVHHIAAQEVPVYKTVHHQASTPRQVTVNGFSRIEWTACPVCGKHHESAYNERLVDHMNEVLCPACGERHAADYDEVIYY